MTTNEDIDYGEITEALNDKADRDFHNLSVNASVPYHISVENNLQSQIDAIAAGADVKAVVGTYADLQSYDKTKLSNNDIVEVLIDEEHNNAKTYYKYVSASNDFTYVGSVGSTYTKTEADNRYVHLTGNETISGVKTFTDNVVLSSSGQEKDYLYKNTSLDMTDTSRLDTIWSFYRAVDKNNQIGGDVGFAFGPDGSSQVLMQARNHTTDPVTKAAIRIIVYNDGTITTSAPNPPTNSNDSSIATTSWVRSTISSLDNAVHRSGDETIAGAKTFNSDDIKIKSTSIQWSTPPDSGSRYSGIIICDKDGKRIGKLEQYQNSNGDIGLGLNVSGYDSSNNIKYSTPITTWIAKDGSSNWTAAPTPAAGDNSTKIATTAWVNSELSHHCGAINDTSSHIAAEKTNSAANTWTSTYTWTATKNCWVYLYLNGVVSSNGVRAGMIKINNIEMARNATPNGRDFSVGPVYVSKGQTVGYSFVEAISAKLYYVGAY